MEGSILYTVQCGDLVEAMTQNCIHGFRIAWKDTLWGFALVLAVLVMESLRRKRL